MAIEAHSLVVGAVYSFRHSRKGEFVAQVINILPGDDADPFLVQVKIDVRRGTDQERIAMGKEQVTVRNLRPSLLTSAERTEESAWLRDVRVPEEAHGEETLGFKLKKLFRRS